MIEQIYRPVNDCFELSDQIKSCHMLYEDFLQERKDVTKFVFYLWLTDNGLKAKRGKDSEGNFGYGLKFKPKEGETK